MSESQALHAHHFDDLEQQQDASYLGMWVFLATEVLFFGGLFLAYTVYRMIYPESFAAISHEIDVIPGTVNTVILLTSSLFMALAVHAAKFGDNRKVIFNLTWTLILALGFLGVKSFEYAEDFHKHLIPGDPKFPFQGTPSPSQELFVWLYYTMTGLHAFHVTIGVGVIAWMLVRARKNEFAAPERHHVIHVAGLYWHFVDAVWVFLFPMLYLVERHQ